MSDRLNRDLIVDALLEKWREYSDSKIVQTPRDFCEGFADAVLEVMGESSGEHDGRHG